MEWPCLSRMRLLTCCKRRTEQKPLPQWCSGKAWQSPAHGLRNAPKIRQPSVQTLALVGVAIVIRPAVAAHLLCPVPGGLLRSSLAQRQPCRRLFVFVPLPRPTGGPDGWLGWMGWVSGLLLHHFPTA